MTEREAKVVSTLLGHKGRCFDVRSNPYNSSQILSSSEDGYVRLWDFQRKACLQSLHHNKDAEVLRASFVAPNAIVSAGSDGLVKVWKDEYISVSGERSSEVVTASAAANRSNFKNIASLDHSGGDSQVYVCEPDHHAEFSERLMTGVENRLLIWDLENRSILHEWQYFDDREEAFGGSARNPDKHNYVFDAKWHPVDSSMAVIALSDCSLSLVDLRISQQDHTFIHLADEELELGHPTSVCSTIIYMIRSE